MNNLGSVQQLDSLKNKEIRNLPDEMTHIKSKSKHNFTTKLTTPLDLSDQKIIFLAVQLFCCFEVPCGMQEGKRWVIVTNFPVFEVLSKELVFWVPESHGVYASTS